MPRELRCVRPLAFAWLPLVLSACGIVDDASPIANGPSADPSSAASTDASSLASLVPTAEASAQAVYVNEAQGWSIVVPPGWEVAANSEGDTALTRDQVTAEILASPASGLTIEQLEAQKVEELSAWPGVDGVEAQIVRLPAGEAVRASLETTTNAGPGILVFYWIEEGERQYVISIRGLQDDGDLLADAEALAESFALID